MRVRRPALFTVGLLAADLNLTDDGKPQKLTTETVGLLELLLAAVNNLPPTASSPNLPRSHALARP